MITTPGKIILSEQVTTQNGCPGILYRLKINIFRCRSNVGQQRSKGHLFLGLPKIWNTVINGLTEGMNRP